MRKAVLKRIRITGTGKLMRRTSGHNHFNAKASRKSQLKKKGFDPVTSSVAKKFKKYVTQS